MNVVKFSIFTFTGSLIWSTALAAGGYVLGKSWDTLVPIIEKIGLFLLAIFIVAFFIYFLYRWYAKRRNTEKSESADKS